MQKKVDYTVAQSIARYLPQPSPIHAAAPACVTIIKDNALKHAFTFAAFERRDVATCSCFQNNGCSGEDSPSSIVSHCALSPQHDAIFHMFLPGFLACPELMAFLLAASCNTAMMSTLGGYVSISNCGLDSSSAFVYSTSSPYEIYGDAYDTGYHDAYYPFATVGNFYKSDPGAAQQLREMNPKTSVYAVPVGVRMMRGRKV